MSFSLAIVDGDLARHGSSFGIVSGARKLEQDLSIWLRERYRSDRFHRSYGSILDNFIGTAISRSTEHEVRAEVSRVLQNYQALQYRRIQENRRRFSPSEILLEVLEIKVATTYDTVRVAIRILTGERREATLSIGAEL